MFNFCVLVFLQFVWLMDGCVVCVALPILWIIIKCCYVEYLKIIIIYWNYAVYVEHKEKSKWETHIR